MPKDRFLIAPLTEGSQTNVKPWLISDKAYALLRNMYTWRGSVKKRFGTRYMNESKSLLQQPFFSRFRINLGNTDAVTGNFSATVPGAIFKIGQQFTIGDTIFTVYQTGTPAAMLTTGTATGTYNTTTGAVVITGNNTNPVTAVYFYPAEPVMELATYDRALNNDEELFGFDTQFAYTFAYTTGWTRSSAGTSTWTGSNSDFYWTSNYRGTSSSDFLLFVTNNKAADAMRYWTGATWTAWGSVGTTPINGAGDFIKTCKVILPFKDRLCLFNVTENIAAADVVFRNRLRFSQNGSPIAADAWREDIAGKGGFLDAPVKESIITAQFLKDQLIVGFENSTWELVYTGNEVLPFRWQQINTELGIESQNSIVPFDKVVMGIGANGIHACNGLNVDRIDELIPYTVFDISNANAGPERVCGIRDYYLELVYWSYPSNDVQDTFSFVYPNRVIVYDYINQTWAYNDDSITAIGNFQFDITLSWQDIDATWEQMQYPWNDPSMIDRFKSVICGNQEGFTFIADSRRSNNARVLSITNITVADPVITITVVDHNLPNGSYVYLNTIQQTGGNMTNLNDAIYKITVTGTSTFQIFVAGITGTYTGGGTVGRVSEIEILTKQYNFYNQIGFEIAAQEVDFYVDKTDYGRVTIDFYVSASSLGLLGDATATGTLVGSSVLETSPYALAPLENSQARFWHSVFFNAQGENVQLRFYLSPDQIMDKNIAFSDFQLNAILFHVVKTGQLASL